jgi:hypothetical protein
MSFTPPPPPLRHISLSLSLLISAISPPAATLDFRHASDTLYSHAALFDSASATLSRDADADFADAALAARCAARR